MVGLLVFFCEQVLHRLSFWRFDPVVKVRWRLDVYLKSFGLRQKYQNFVAGLTHCKKVKIWFNKWSDEVVGVPDRSKEFCNVSSTFSGGESISCFVKNATRINFRSKLKSPRGPGPYFLFQV